MGAELKEGKKEGKNFSRPGEDRLGIATGAIFGFMDAGSQVLKMIQLNRNAPPEIKENPPKEKPGSFFNGKTYYGSFDNASRTSNMPGMQSNS